MENKIFVKKLVPDVEIPKRAKFDDNAAFDFYMPCDGEIFHSTASNKIGLGVAMEIPRGFFLLIALRSSTGKNSPLRLSNGVGIIDSNYRGEICLLIDNISQWQDVSIRRGQRIAQGILLPRPDFSIEEKEVLSDTERGVGGFGSTGE